ncbi:MAG: rhodanese-like domain-containing protein [Chloroflexi bacterium]|nr:rhodanese-like domain-containing protein [Chloroflexota bacterium]
MEQKSSAEMVQEAKARIENLTVDQVADEIGKEDTLLVDLRESEERHQHGAIPGSMSVPRGLLEFWADPASALHKKEFELDRRVILYCSAGGRSALAADVLQQLGFSNVAHLDSGFTGWNEAGQPIDKLDMWAAS